VVRRTWHFAEESVNRSLIFVRFVPGGTNRHGRQTESANGTFTPFHLCRRCRARADDESLEREIWRSHWTATAWREYLGAGKWNQGSPSIVNARTQAGPPGTAEFIQSLEKAMQRRLTLKKRGLHENSLRIEDNVNSHSIVSNLCFLKVPVPSDG
jgi:hypothetical protein